MINALARLFSGPSGLTPHGFCLLWDPSLLSMHVVADAIIGLSYLSISLALFWIARLRRDLVFKPVFGMFAAFILLCGTGHWFDLATLWVPLYRLQGLVKITTALASMSTAIVLWALWPRLLAFPSPTQMRAANRALQLLASERGQAAEGLRRSEAALRDMNETLEARVAERTAALTEAVTALHAEAHERGRAEDALRQSQKMEAVGLLTGGIAHDFNNMLQSVGANLELIQQRMAQGRALEIPRFAGSAQKGVARAAALTNRLLAFARRQALEPRVVEPNQLIHDMEELIRRTVGPSIVFERSEREGVWAVLCDPNQLENALLNLVINARDAMPDRGRLTIATAGVHVDQQRAGEAAANSGDYVEISVSDTGSGMDEITRSRAFEPFFTTKPIGQGTGLGLSQIYGFIRQSGGFVTLDSVVGQGTTVCLYLPRQPSVKLEGALSATSPERSNVGVGGTILLVEDEQDVRAATAEHLRELRYAVLEAADGAAALELLCSQQRLDILVSDVGLPGGLNGRQLADAARECRPGLPVLFITGYAPVAAEGRLAAGMQMMSKPFALEDFAARLSTMLTEATLAAAGAARKSPAENVTSS